MTEPSKPRQFLIVDHTDNSGFSVVEISSYDDDHIPCNVTHVIEYFAFEVAEQRANNLQAGLNYKQEEFQKETLRCSELFAANVELSRKLAKAVEQRNQMTATFWANCDYLTATESEKRYDDQISELDAELNGDK